MHIIINKKRFFGIISFCLACRIIFVANLAQAASITWTGLGADDNWTTSANWDSRAPLGGDTLLFLGNAHLHSMNDYSAPLNLQGIVFDTTADAFVLAGGTVNLNGNIVNNSTALQSLDIDMVLQNANRTINTAAGDILFAGNISGAYGLIKTGSGTLTLQGADKLTGNQGTFTINGGTIRIDAGLTEAYSASITGSNTGLTVSGGSLTLASSLTMSASSNALNVVDITGGALTCGTSLTIGSNYSNSTMQQSGGTVKAKNLQAGVRGKGTYKLSGSALLSTTESNVGGNYGQSSFIQTGGTHLIASNLTVAGSSTGGSTPYYQLDDGTLSSHAVFLGDSYGTGVFYQNGGTCDAGFLGVKATCSYVMQSGVLKALDSAYVSGELNLGTNPAQVSVGGIVNLSGATLLGGSETEFTVAANSLIIFSENFNPYAQFKSFVDNGALIAYAGKDIDIAADRIVYGSGSLVGHVNCSGSLIQQAGYSPSSLSFISNNSINIKTGISVDGGVARLGSTSNVYIIDQISGISDGELQSNQLNVGYNADGKFVQTGGNVSASFMWIGISTGNSRVTGIYSIAGGTLTSAAGITMGATQGNGTIEQTSGFVQVGGTLIVGTGGHAGPPSAHYLISGGTLSAAGITVGGIYAEGAFEVYGAGATIVDTNNFSLAVDNNAGAGKLISHVQEDGLSMIFVSGNATLNGIWEIIDENASCGRWNVLMANGGVSTPGSVILPDATWTWGIDSGTTLWVQHVPEPNVFLALLAGGLVYSIVHRRLRNKMSR